MGAAEEAFAAAGMPEGSGEEYLQRDVETPGGQRTTVKPSAKTDKTEEEDEQDKAASPEAAKEGSASSSDDEEWTVLSDKKPEAEAVQIPIQVLDKEVAPVYPKEHDHLCERDPGPGRSSSRLCPSSNRSPPRPSDPGGLAGDDEHGLLQRRRLARQPARGQGRGHRQGARHPPTGQEVDIRTSLESLSAASLWSCLLETNPYIYLGASIGRTPTLCCHCLKHKWSSLYLHWYLCRDIYIYVFPQIAIWNTLLS